MIIIILVVIKSVSKGIFMDPVTRASSLNVLNQYYFGCEAGEREYLLCIKRENGKETLEKISRVEVTSWFNQVLKFIGLGPLANCDTSISHIENFVEQLFTTDRKDGAHHATATKTASIASKGEHPLMHLFEMAQILKAFPVGIEQAIPLEDLILISNNIPEINKETPINNFQEIARLIKRNIENEEMLRETQTTDHEDNELVAEFCKHQKTINNQRIQELL